MAEEKNKRVLEVGPWGRVAYAVRLSGICEAQQWLEAQTSLVKSKFDHLFRALAANGRIFNREQFRKLEGEIWEFKRGPDRILCFRIGRCWYLTHHFQKGGQKCPRSEISRATQIRAEHLASTKEESNGSPRTNPR